MKKNYTLNILGRKIKVVFKKLDERYCGLYYDKEGLIEINTDMDESKTNISILHEVLHSIFFRSGLDQTNIGHDLQEIICDQFAKAICENFTLKRKIKWLKK